MDLIIRIAVSSETGRPGAGNFAGSAGNFRRCRQNFRPRRPKSCRQNVRLRHPHRRRKSERYCISGVCVVEWNLSRSYLSMERACVKNSLFFDPHVSLLKQYTCPRRNKNIPLISEMARLSNKGYKGYWILYNTYYISPKVQMARRPRK